MNQLIYANSHQSDNYMNDSFGAQEWNGIISISWLLLPPIGPKIYNIGFLKNKHTKTCHTFFFVTLKEKPNVLG